MYYTKERPLRVFEAFAGYGSQLLALRRLERDFPGQIKVVPVGFSEIDPSAIKAYKALHGDVRNYGDISKIDWSDVPDFDLFTMSSPCFVAGTLILTDGGYKPIEEVKVGENILTLNTETQEIEVKPIIRKIEKDMVTDVQGLLPDCDSYTTPYVQEGA